ncbi:MAG TPA: hypothetical protein VLG12_01605 [Candidatus Saccharimonadales bacterium]|nr:hypothetical protein [Candidatus Saccharimonadales bacterium]
MVDQITITSEPATAQPVVTSPAPTPPQTQSPIPQESPAPKPEQPEVSVDVTSASSQPPNVVITPPSDGEQEEEKENKWMTPLMIGLGICGVLLLLGLGWLIFFNKAKVIQIPQVITQVITPTPLPPKTYTTMSGFITFQGYAPAGAYLAISERADDKADFKDVVSGLTSQNGSIPWSWNSAVQGTNYQIRALLKVQGKIIQESAVSAVSAPATNVVLPLVSEQNPPQPQQVTISGIVHIDGYLPTGSTFSIVSRPTGNGNFNTVVSKLPAQDGATWSWPSANSGDTYDLNVQIYDGSGNLISANSPQTITAPSSGLVFTVSSTAQPPAPAITGISGTINMNGSIPSNSYITLGTRPSSSNGSFNQVGGNIAATNGATWSWSSAQSGTQYDVQAYLWVNGQPYAQSSIITVTAPSQNDTLTINAQQQVGAPGGNTISVTCNGQSNNAYQATINYNTQTNLNNPVSYNIVVTLASQGSQVMNTTVTPGNPTQSQALTTTYIFTPGSTYYAQYAYSNSSNTNSFSPLSPAVQFSCQ